MRPKLKLFVGGDEPETLTFPEPEVSISLGELSQILTDAMIWDRTWVADFADDEVKISADLYDVLATYVHLRPSA